MVNLTYIPEPGLMFRFDQECLDPRDGLTLFGPLELPRMGRIQWAAVGSRECIERMKRWVKRIQGPVKGPDGSFARPLFPGFEAVFRTTWDPKPSLEIVIPADEIFRRVLNSDGHQRTFQTAELFVKAIQDAKRNEECTPDVWCVLIPEEVYTYCRPQSKVPSTISIKPEETLSKKELRASESMEFLFPEMKELKQEYEYENNFHHQLKARLLKDQVPLQIIRESKIAGSEELNAAGHLIGPNKILESAIAWNLSTAIYYKAGGKPWRLGAGREGVCYIGLVFKQIERAADQRTACCAAQMFLNSGDGVVFRGAVGPWYHEKRGAFHLNRKAAKEIVQMCVETYTKQNGTPPAELFIHGLVNLHDEEWEGFLEGGGTSTAVVGVQIRPSGAIKLYRSGRLPILRGSAYLVDGRSGYLWTKGMIPRLKTYPGRGVPNPIYIKICRGNANIRTVMADVLALTKLNYNSCTFGDGKPVTLKFADAVGEILTAGPTSKINAPPLPFKYYI